MILEKSQDTLGQLFEGLYGMGKPVVNPVDEASLRHTLLQAETLQSDVIALVKLRLKGADLSVRQMGILKFCQQLLSDYFAHPVFHPALGKRLTEASGALIAEAFSPHNWLLKKQHPVGALLENIAQVAAGWEPGLAQAEELQGTLVSWVRPENLADSLEQRLARSVEWLGQHRQRFEKISQRIIASETGILRVNHAQQVAAKYLNKLLAQRQVPEMVQADFNSHWLQAFQWVVLHEGEKSALWQQVGRQLNLLLWSLSPEAAQPDSRQKLSRVSDQMAHELTPLLEKVLGDPLLAAGVWERIQLVHHGFMAGMQVDFVEVPAIRGSGSVVEMGAEVSQDLLDEVAAISEDDWFLEADTGRRIRLLLKQDDYQQLIFVNQLGIKAATYSYEEFAWQFSTARISTLPRTLPLIDWVSERLNRLVEKYRAQKQAQDKAVQEAKQKAAEETARREQARQKALQEARQIAEEKARQEAERTALHEAEIEMERSRREAEAQEHGQSEAQRRQRARLLVSSLTMGAWASFFDDTGGSVRRKLAVILPSSGKYIFVDHMGSDKLDVTKDALIEGIAEGSITLVQQDNRFDDALSRVVDGIRAERG